MSDIVDRSADREEELRVDALAEQARRAGLSGKTVDDSAFRCAFCNDPIPLRRRELIPGVQTCVDCQSDREMKLPQKGMGL